jgi:RHS repeat-associated protein
MELDGSGNRRRAYTHYPGIDQPHSVREFTGTNAGRYYFAMELPGHVTGLLNASGARVNHYGYSAFGKLEHVYESVPNPLRYMAREWDPDAGLYYVRNRWYDPEVGRFISEDPIGLAGGINVYAYAAEVLAARNPCRTARADVECAG